MCWGVVLQSGDVDKDGDATRSDDVVDGRYTSKRRYSRVANELPLRDSQDSALAFYMECLEGLGIC